MCERSAEGAPASCEACVRLHGVRFNRTRLTYSCRGVRAQVVDLSIKLRRVRVCGLRLRVRGRVVSCETRWAV
jgi:hypothetical protein